MEAVKEAGRETDCSAAGVRSVKQKPFSPFSRHPFTPQTGKRRPGTVTSPPFSLSLYSLTTLGLTGPEQTS